MQDGAGDGRAEAQLGDIVELWIECPGCGLRFNVLDTLPGCRCRPRFWLVLPELTKRLSRAA